MITTVTANPAVDYTVEVDNLELATANRADYRGEAAGGKGINVSQAVDKLGVETKALGCLGGRTGRFIADRLADREIPTDFNWTETKTRRNIKVIDDSNQETRINLRGRVPSQFESKLKQKVIKAASESQIIVLSGSLPVGFSDGFYRDLIDQAELEACSVFLDTSGRPLKLALEVGPELIKPNQQELEEVYGRELDREELIQASKKLVEQGIDQVLVSRGPKGAILITEQGSLEAVPPTVEPVSTIGAGDSIVAGMAVGTVKDWSLERQFRFAIGESVATILTPGAKMGNRDKAEKWSPEVEIRRLKLN